MTTPTFSPERKARILVVDDYPLVRYALTQLVTDQADMTIIAQVDSPSDAAGLLAQHSPDLLVTEITSDGKPAMDLIRDLHTAHPNLPILVLSILDETFWAERVLRAGCRGFVMKREATPTILGAIRKVLSGEIWVSERVSSTMIRRVATGRDAVSASPLEHLSDRELEIFQMLGAGLTSREIAQRLHLSVKTVDGHRDRMKEKLQMESSAKLLRYAILSTIAAA